jgi:hypothetical protein
MDKRMSLSPNQAVLNSEPEQAPSQSPLNSAGAQEKATAAAAADHAALQRAEALVDQFGERIVQYSTRLGLGLGWVAARAREEPQDIWAEAQHIRKRGQN